MRTTMILDGELVRRAQALSNIVRKTDLVHAGLRALIAQASRERLTALGGSERKLRPIRRRRTSQAGT
jgi:hypothetical protein